MLIGSINQLDAVTDKMKSLTDIYRKAEEINANFEKNLTDFHSLAAAWSNFMTEQTLFQSKLIEENGTYFSGFHLMRDEVAQLTAKMNQNLSEFAAYKQIIADNLVTLDKQMLDFRSFADENMQKHSNGIQVLRENFSLALEKLNAAEVRLSENEIKNGATLLSFEQNIALIRGKINEFLQSSLIQIAENLENLSRKTAELAARSEQVLVKQEAAVSQILLNFAQKNEQQLNRQDLLLTQNLTHISGKLEQSVTFSQNQMQKSEELFREMQIRFEEKNAYFAKQISDIREMQSQFSASADEKNEKSAKDNRKFYGDLEDGLRVRIDQLKSEFQLKVREELDSHITRNDIAVRTQLGEFQNRLEEKAESRFRSHEGKFSLVLLALAANFLALMFLIFAN